jgi:outer membrane receptor protein involved in Fe transport
MRKVTITQLFAFVCALFFSSSLSAQTQISGKIIDKANGEGLIGAAVMIDKTTRGVLTDIEGNFTLPVDAAGNYTLVISFISYESAKVTVDVKANETAFVNYAMAESKNVMQEVVITATAERSTAVAQMIERKKAVQVSDGITADLIRRTPDRTTSDVLKRVTGASIQEGKFAVIRGMNDRYNAGYLDGALLPSTESDRKAFAFDVVPANLIDNLTILKAGSADLVGDFGGGIIRINTKAVPEKMTQNLSIGMQTHSLTTGKDFFQYKTYGGEAFNIISKERDLPNFTEGSMKVATGFATAAERTRLAENSLKFNNDWSSSVENAPINTRFNYSLGFPVKLKGANKLGVIMALTYANTRRTSDNVVNSYDDNGKLADFADVAYNQNVNLGGIFNINFMNERTQINFRNILNTTSDNNTLTRKGFANIADNFSVDNTSNILNYNRLLNSIVSLKQIIGNNFMTLNGSVNYSNVRRRIPDYRIAGYSLPSGATSLTPAVGDFFNSSSGRFTSDLNEQVVGTDWSLSKSFGGDKVKTDVKIGAFYQNRNRDFFARNFVFNGSLTDVTRDPAVDFGTKGLGANRLYYVEKTIDELAYYNGTSGLTAFYAQLDQKYSEKLRAVYGLRYENADIRIDNEKVNAQLTRLQQAEWLPSINLNYSLSEKSSIRASYFRSVNRPEFRELAPFAFYVFDKNADIIGNLGLQIARLNNYDLRFEFYPTGGQILSAGVFAKTITNPIEFGFDLSQPFTTFNFQNEKSAVIYGAEFEIKKNLDFIGSQKFWSNLSLFSNLSLMQSALTFREGSNAAQNRPLQGQSPFILNAGLQFDDRESGWFASAVVNRIGSRIAFVGADAKFAPFRLDIYEKARTVVDLQVGKNIKQFNIKLTIGDMLRQDLVFFQDVNGNKKFNAAEDRQMFLYRNGFTTNLALSYNF